MIELNKAQQDVLRRAQRLPAGAIFSRRKFKAKQKTMQTLLYEGLIVYVDQVWDGNEMLPYYRLSAAGKQVQL